MNFRTIMLASLVSAAASLFAAMPSANAATYIYVGSWEVDSGPSWTSAPPNGPLAYTGQEAAALLFGGTAANYVTSTVDINPADINFDAWYSVIGYEGPDNGGVLLADDYSSKYLGQYYGPSSDYPDQDPTAAASAYVADNAQGDEFINYAFEVEGVDGVPEPATWALLILGFGATGFTLRRRRTQGTLALVRAR